MKYLVIFTTMLLFTGCSKSMQEVEHLVNSCKAAGGEPIIRTMREGYVDTVRCKKDGALYMEWEGKSNEKAD